MLDKDDKRCIISDREIIDWKVYLKDSDLKKRSKVEVYDLIEQL